MRRQLRTGTRFAVIAFVLCAAVPTAARATDGLPASTIYDQTTPQPQGQKDQDKHSSFLKWVHIDGLWMPGQSDSRTVGLIGMHVAVARIGRLNMFGPPGVMVVRQKSSRGVMTRPAFTWGVGYELTNMRVPGISRPMTLFLNIAKCWTAGNVNTGMSMFGLSATWDR